MTTNRPEFKAHDDFIFEHKKIGKVTREEFIKYIRSSHDHMRKLSQIIQQYDQTIDEYLNEWDGRLESFDEDVKVLLGRWIDDGTMDHIINENLMSIKADKSYVDDLNENVTTQLAQIVNINITDFGLIGDGLTDNSQATTDLNDYIANLTNVERINLFFPRGVYKTYVGLLIDIDHVIIEGNNAVLDKHTPGYAQESVSLTLLNAKTIEVSGVEFRNTVDDKDTPVEVLDLPSKFYHINVENKTKSLESINIHRNRFIDDVSVPNTIKKPFNGQIWIGNYDLKSENIHIYDNEFIDPVGRIIYVTNSKNVHIKDNIFTGVGVLKYTPKYQLTAHFVFRVLSSENINVHDNTIIGTKGTAVANEVRIFELNANDDEQTGTRISSENGNCHNNTIKLHNLKNTNIIRLESIKNTKFHNNNIVMTKEPSNHFVFARPIIEPYHRYIGIAITDNNVYNPPTEVVNFASITTDTEKFNVLMENNNIFTDVVLSRLGAFQTNIVDKSLMMRQNKLFVNGLFHSILGALNQFSRGRESELRFPISESNIDNHIKNGVLAVSNITSIVSFATSETIPLTEITNIVKDDGTSFLEGERILLKHTGGNGFDNIVVKSNNTDMRLDGGHYTFTRYGSLELVYISGMWYNV